ncbi:histidine kinase [Longispora sp. K20-0274]|uniref:sensor histidine kinase n=1 Tax=Longispora sp. K20-0274 TaxID=3088255 RepID=UPI00399A6146
MFDLPLADRLRALPPLLVDGALVAVVLIAQLWPFLGGPVGWWGAAMVLGSSLPLLWRRHAPLAVLAISMLSTSLYDLGGPEAAQPVWYGGLVAMATVASRSPRWARLTALGVTTALGLASVGSSDTALRGLILFGAAYAIGRSARTSRAYAAALEERAERDAERAAATERAKIARDMHDILSHAVSIMVVQAEAGPLVVRSKPERAEAAFEAIAGAGRDAMEQLRRMLGVLKEEPDARTPQPTLADLPTLARDLPGLTVSYSETGTAGTIAADSAVAAYRVTQEALTNVVRHSGADRARILLRWETSTLTIEILDDGPGTGRSLPSGGHGLVGMRERATACGGTLTAGRRGTGFAVTLRLPVTT